WAGRLHARRRRLPSLPAWCANQAANLLATGVGYCHMQRADRAPLATSLERRDVGPFRCRPALPYCERATGGTVAMMRFGRFRFLALLSAAFVAMMLVSVDFAEARRGGSFGSRGFRTQQSAPPTRTAPTQTGPVERSM